LSLQDEVFMGEDFAILLFGKTLSDDFLPQDSNTILTSKPIDSTTTNYDGNVELQEAVPSDADPVISLGKYVDATPLYDGVTLDDNTVSPTESDYLNADGLTYRKGISEYQIGKLFNSLAYDHYLNDGTTLDNETVTSSESLNSKDIEKSLATHYLYDEVTQDTNEVTTSDTTGTNSTRTVPYIVLNKSIDSTTTNYDGNVELEEAVPTDSGGSLWLSPYTDPYPAANSYFANDSGNYTEGESAFTG